MPTHRCLGTWLAALKCFLSTLLMHPSRGEVLMNAVECPKQIRLERCNAMPLPPQKASARPSEDASNNVLKIRQSMLRYIPPSSSSISSRLSQLVQPSHVHFPRPVIPTLHAYNPRFCVPPPPSIFNDHCRKLPAPDASTIETFRVFLQR